MDALKGLHLIETVETRLMRMYGTLARRFSDHSEAKLFFTDMRKDEHTHMEMARMEIRMVREAGVSHSDAIMDEAEIQRVLALADRLIKEEMSLTEALGIVYEIEDSAAELYVITALQKVDPKISSLLNTMGETFRLHRAFVHDFLEAHGVHAEKLEGRDIDAAPAPVQDSLEKDTALLINNPGQDELLVYAGAVQSAGFDVTTAAGRSGTEEMLKEHPHLGIILMVIDTEEDENFSLLKSIRSMGPYMGVPIIVLTTNYGDEFFRSLSKKGATLIYHKMSTPPEKLKDILTSTFGPTSGGGATGPIL